MRIFFRPWTFQQYSLVALAVTGCFQEPQRFDILIIKWNCKYDNYYRHFITFNWWSIFFSVTSRVPYFFLALSECLSETLHDKKKKFLKFWMIKNDKFAKYWIKQLFSWKPHAKNKRSWELFTIFDFPRSVFLHIICLL